MKRAILSLAAGLLLWVAVITVLNLSLRIFVAGYAAAEPTMSFTPGMLAGRLALAALTSLIAGALAGWIAPASAGVPVLLGVVLLAAVIPVHARLWGLFPFWYHLIFLATLVPLVVLGAYLSRLYTGAAVPAGSRRA